MKRKYAYPVVAIAVMTALAAPAGASEKRTIKQDGYTLVFRDLAATTDQGLIDRLTDTFFATYLRMAAAFNPKASHKVEFDLDPSYTGIANTSRNRIQFNPDWFVRHPTDIDMAVHEAMHVVQAYKHDDEPGWLVEGIADYARAVYGQNNDGAGWGLPVPGPDSRYDQGYRVAARFLLWAEKNGHPGLVQALDAKMRAGRYRDADWQALTGSSLDQLWAAYLAAETQPLHITITHPVTPEQLEKAKALIAKMEADNKAKEAASAPHPANQP